MVVVSVAARKVSNEVGARCERTRGALLEAKLILQLGLDVGDLVRPDIVDTRCRNHAKIHVRARPLKWRERVCASSSLHTFSMKSDGKRDR